MRSVRSFAAVVVLWLCVGSQSPAFASCAQLPPVGRLLSNAPVAFVGTVTGVADRGRAAAVKVEATWKGAALPDQVAVVGNPTDAGVFSSADRTFTPGQRYLFLPLDDSTPFRDDACTGTRVYSHALDRFAPPGGVPTGTPHPGNPSSSSPLNLVSVTLVVALLAAAAWQVARARRHAARPWGDQLLGDPRTRTEPVDNGPPD